MLAGATGMQLKCKFQGRIGGISRQSHQAPGTKAPPQAPRPPQSPSQTPKPPLKKPRLTWGR